jgi:diguanylate cyclase (GGDEF)-like protein/PAS domain S-box-containing protein
MSSKPAKSLPRRVPTVRSYSIVAGLSLFGLIAILFSIVVVQLGSGVSAYLAGESMWSRGQVEAVRNLDLYAQTGNPEQLEQARYWYKIPMGDFAARREMESPDMDYQLVREGFLQGQNHPDDILRMVILFKLFKDLPYFRESIAAWRATDAPLLELGKLMQQLNAAWQRDKTSSNNVLELHQRLKGIDIDLSAQAMEFRLSMSKASRALGVILSVASIVFFILLIGLAAFLVLRLTRVIRASERNFRMTFEHAPVGIVRVDNKGLILEANDAMCDLLGYSREDLQSLYYNELIFIDDISVGREQRIALERGNIENTSLEQRLRRADGSLVWTKIAMSRLATSADERQQFIGILEDVSDAHHLAEKLNYQAGHDDLTGLINRRSFEIYLEEALHLAHSEDFVHALCFIDLDRFKVVNDTVGHFVGDELLRQVADQLSRHLRKGDLLARIGGDEFGLILNCCEPDAAVKIAEKLRSALIENPFIWEDHNFNIGCSVGLVPITARSVNTAELIKAADAACNVAKEQGRNQVLMLAEEDTELATRRQQTEWLAKLRNAIEADTLFLDAQRIVCNEEHGFIRYEVFVRLLGDRGEAIPPGAFLPAAERFGFSASIDRWVIEHVCHQLASYPEHLEALEACHINLSGHSFEDTEFVNFVIETLTKYCINGEKLCFEIDEQDAVRNLADIKRFMATLRTWGCSFALDNVGKGLSSFSYLKELPVDFLKLDGVLVQTMLTDKTDQAMLRAINDIGQTLNKRMVAEFVENSETLALLNGMGVEYVQGFHVHQPERFSDWIENSWRETT